MKKTLSLLLCICLLVSAGAVTAFADNSISAGDARAVIGANLTDEQIESVYNMFGILRGEVSELTVTNAEERTYLEGLVSDSVIGTNSISCVYLEILPEGEGLEIATYNLNWCTQEMFINAVVTAGIYDARIIVAAPFEVSGTAALTGIYKAYEDITGETLDDIAKLISTQELVITAEIAEAVGSFDAAQIVNEIKLILNETVDMSDDELKDAIVEIVKDYDVSLTSDQISQLITLARSLEGLDSDQLKEKVEYVQNLVKKLAEAKDTVSVITEKVRQIVDAISSFIDKLVAFFTGG